MSQRTEGDLQFILPKKGSATLSVHQEDSSDVTKTIDLLIEDFQEKLNDAVQRQILNEEFITSSRFPIGGYQHAVVSIFMPGNYPDRVFVYVWMKEMKEALDGNDEDWGEFGWDYDEDGYWEGRNYYYFSKKQRKEVQDYWD